MNRWSNIRQSVDRSAKRAAPWIARVAGIVTAIAGIRTFWLAIGQKFLQPFIGGVLLVALGVGVALLRQTALKLASIRLVALAILLPIGVLNPFAEMDRVPARFYAPGFEVKQVALVLVTMTLAVLLAHFIGLARVQRLMSKANSASAADPKAR